MYNQSYEEYMRSVLGYNMNPSNTYTSINDAYTNAGNMQFVNIAGDVDLDGMYPDIYNIVYPLVQKKCRQCNSTITKETIDDMVDEIYEIVEPSKEADKKETRQKNFILSDLIKILLLRELIGNRPPMPPRPPFPGNRPSYPGNRPPIMPRGHMDDLYEY